MRDSLGATIVIVTHELASIFAIANNCVFLDTETRTQIATGDPKELLAYSKDPKIRQISHSRHGKESRLKTMSKRFSPTAIGMFVVGSFALLVGAIVVVGSGKMFQKPVQFVCFFPGAVNGLKVGAPVKVSRRADRQRSPDSAGSSARSGPGPSDLKDLRLPVILNIDGSQLRAMGGTGQALTKWFDDFVKQGLRAQLNVESLLTGLLYVDLDLYPQTPIVLSLEPGSSSFREIPTVPTDFQHVQEEAQKALDRISKMDLEGLMKSISGAGNRSTPWRVRRN